MSKDYRIIVSDYRFCEIKNAVTLVSLLIMPYNHLKGNLEVTPEITSDGQIPSPKKTRKIFSSFIKIWPLYIVQVVLVQRKNSVVRDHYHHSISLPILTSKSVATP